MNDFLNDERPKGKVIAIHSSRGGTGKTVVATNLAITYANKGLNVALLDLDFRAPSLINVFSEAIKMPVKHWLNDFINGKCTIAEALVDVSKEYNLKGELLVGLANPSVDAIRSITGKSQTWEVSAVKRLFSLRSGLFDDLKVDYCFFDTSPGISYSSVNAVMSSDVSILVTNPGSMNTAGFHSIIVELYDTLEKRTGIILNKVFPEPQKCLAEIQDPYTEVEEIFKRHPLIGIIPCYCDMLQAKRASLLALEKPGHPFLREIEAIAEKIELMN